MTSDVMYAMVEFHSLSSSFHPGVTTSIFDTSGPFVPTLEVESPSRRTRAASLSLAGRAVPSSSGTAGRRARRLVSGLDCLWSGC